MTLSPLDWIIVAATYAVTLSIGFASIRFAKNSTGEFFLSGRNMPWWVLGISMVATTFSADTPNLVTDIVRKNGVSGNWVWWAFLLTGMLTVFVYARLWRRSGVVTDLEFYELRYSGRSASILRGFRAVYLGLFFNIVIMATVSLAAIKIGGVLLGLSPLHSLLWASGITVVVAAVGGLRAVLLSDLFLFVLSMAGAIAAAWFAVTVPEIGSLEALTSAVEVRDKLSFLPQLVPTGTADDATAARNLLVTALIIPLAVQWWSVWYPGAEPGGGGYVAQRMLAARDEKQARAAALIFTALFYGLRPWPWIIVALCSLVIFPDLASLATAFPDADPSIINDDLAYPAMLQRVLPHGWLGLVVASLLAAYVSTISTHLNWGSSYIVNDCYQRFIRPDASESELVNVGRVCTIVMMIIAGTLALKLSSALQGFEIMLQFGAGTGLLFILRWFWWRINAAAEIVAMLASFVIALVLKLNDFGLASWQELVIGVTLTTLCWLATAFIAPPTDTDTLKRFCCTINPGGPGWRSVYRLLEREGRQPEAAAVNIPRGILCMMLGSLAVYAVLFGTGYALYGNTLAAVGLFFTALLSAAAIVALRFND